MIKSLPSRVQAAWIKLRRQPKRVLGTSRQPGSQASSVSIPHSVAQALSKASIAVAWVRTTEGLVLAAVVLMAGLAASCLVDVMIHTPRPVRLLFFVLQIGAVIIILWRRVWRALAFKPSDRESAFLLQKKFPALRSAPISALELSCSHGRSHPGSVALIERLGAETATLLRGISPEKVASPNAIPRFLKILAALAAVNAGWIALLWPGSPDWLARWPGLNVPPPTHTLVRDVTIDLVARQGSKVELRARAEGVVPRLGRVRLEFADGTSSEIPALPAPSPAPQNEFLALVGSAQTPFRYSFALNDGEGNSHRVQVVVPPAIAEFSIHEVFPAYTKRPPRDHATGDMEFLVGSTLEVKIKATQDLKSASCKFVGPGTETPLAVSKSSVREASATVAVPPELTGLSFPLVNHDGIASVEDTVFRATSIEDKPPNLVLLGRASDVQSLTPGAAMDIAYTCTDDFGISKIVLRYAVTNTNSKEGLPDSAFASIPLPIPESGQSTYSWKPGTLPGAAPGKTISYYLEATDNRVPKAGLSKSEPRLIAIITSEEKLLEDLRRLREAAQHIRELSDKQMDAQEQLQENSGK